MADGVIDSLYIDVKLNGDNAEKGLNSLNQTLSRLANITGNAGKENADFSSKLGKLTGTSARVDTVLKRVSNVAGSWINKSNEYIESMNLVNVSMGNMADSAVDYAKKVQTLIGINMKDWLNAQGAFNQIAEGFGISSDAAYTMSQNLTQVAYDLSSLWNVPVSQAFTKLQSGMSGQIKGLKDWGINISVAQLRETALAHGIELSTAKMTEAQKATLRYITIMEQSKNAQGDLARTIATPANAMRILQAQADRAKIALGQLISVVAVKVIPYFQAFLQAVEELTAGLARFFGFNENDYDFSSKIDAATGSTTNFDDALGDAAENAEKLKNSLVGIDELNKLGDATAGASAYGGGYDPTFGIDLGQYDYNFLDGLEKVDIEPLKEKFKTLLVVALEIGGAILAWKVSSNLLSTLDTVKKRLSEINGFDFKFGLTFGGLTLFLADLDKLRKYLKDISDNGLNLSNGVGVLSEFAGLVGDISIMLGGIKLGGALKVVQGVGEIVSAVADMSKNGINWNNATDALRGLTNVAIGIGIFTGHLDVAGWSMAVQGLTGVIGELGSNWEAIRKGDWSGVDKVTLVVSGLEIFGGLFMALNTFSKVKAAANLPQAVTDVQDVSNTLPQIDSGVSNLTSKLQTFAKNLGWGILILAEVAVAAGIFVGAVWGLGLMLQQVATAWQPVVDNYGTVLAALGTSAVILGVVGVATGLMGTKAGALAANIILGTLILLELAVPVALFIAEVWAIGKGLEQIGIAWQPVVDNGETIATAIGLGTALLIGIGVVTAALGVAAVASVGLLPLAIGLGTAMLVELSAATLLFIGSLVKVADALSKKLHPALENLNGILPPLSVEMDNFTKFMKFFAGQVVSYSKSSAISGFAATVDSIISFFTKDPIKKMAEDANNTYKQSMNLNSKLRLANPELQIAIGLVRSYYNFLEELERLTEKSSNISLANGMFVSMKEVGKNLVSGFVKGIKSEMNSLSGAVKDVLKDTFTDRLAKSYGNDFGKTLGSSIVSGFKGTSFPTLQGTVNVTDGGSVSLKLKAYAEGGFPSVGEIFVAKEAGPEMVGTIGNKSAVVNNEQIIAGISEGVSDANAEQNALLREQNSLLRKLLEKDTVVNNVIGANDIIDGLKRKNRRDGKTTVPVSG